MTSAKKYFLLFLISIGFESIYANEIRTILKCDVVLNSFHNNKPYSKDDPVAFELHIITNASNDYIEFETPGKSTVGASISFSTKKFYYKKISNIVNLSTENLYSYKFDVMQPTGELYAQQSFALSRYSGMIKIEDKSRFFYAESSGKCEPLKSRIF